MRRANHKLSKEKKNELKIQKDIKKGQEKGREDSNGRR